ncbi:MAG: oxygen-independent coproporphyrinogen III oxidase [Deltaproteobacteria bacterium]|nr:oxygen-independent coproporphyrinogen III oxidase [Deltaproteobacteria bacterium]
MVKSELSSVPQLHIDAETLVRLDRPCPRYTSYPTADRFSEDVRQKEHQEALAKADAQVDRPLALYFHLPFCPTLCTYCGCTVVVSKSETKRQEYLAALGKEMEMICEYLAQRREVVQLHLGGGTPNACTPDELSGLLANVRKRFSFVDDAELSLEVDPRRVEPGQLQKLADIGFNRVSMGVQDFSLDVQEAIGRHQTIAETKQAVDDAKAAGFKSVNLDLVYGLPAQTLPDFKHTIEEVLKMNPDRVALFSFAYVPHVRPHQKKIPVVKLVKAPKKAELFLFAREAFLAAGYVAVGMDHFAKPDDTLAIAAQDGSLRRNFQGYTFFSDSSGTSVSDGAELLGFGMSGISEVGDGYFANPRRYNDYMDAISEERFPVARGVLRNDEDRICAAIIEHLMCQFKLENDWVKEEFNLDLLQDFPVAQQKLAPLVDEGLVERQGEDLIVTDVGRFFVRLVAACFDARWHRDDDDGPRYSQAV